MPQLKHGLLVSSLLMSLEIGASIKNLIDKLCVRYKASDCELVHAIVYKETNYRSLKHLDSNKEYSYGPMMIQCETARSLGLKYGCDQLYIDPMIGVRFGIKYLQFQLKRYSGDIKKAISAYNMGTAIICKDHNPGHCYPGESFNYYYVNEVWRRYKWLRKKKHKQIARFLPRYKNLAGSEISRINTR